MASSKKRSENKSRDAGIVAGTVLAVLIAVFVIWRTIQSQQPVIAGTVHGLEGKATKLQAMQRMKQGGAGGGMGQDLTGGSVSVGGR